MSGPDSKNYLNENYRKKNPVEKINIGDIAQHILKGDRVALSRGITLVESENPAHFLQAEELIQLCLPHTGKSFRIGITGVPGAGKSTFIEAFGKFLIREGKKVAVLAIDPSSTKNKGSILGDKTRMEELSIHENAFIRPTPSGGALGGVARKTREAMLLCEAAGFDIVLIETVGVGQSETEVHSMVDLFLLLLISGAGDDLQGIKRGIVEMADLLIINKDDGDNHSRAQKAKSDYLHALHLFPPASSGWIPTVETCSALEEKGIDKIWSQMQSFLNTVTINGHFTENRKQQNLALFRQSIQDELRRLFFNHPDISTQIPDLEAKIASGILNPYSAAHQVMETFKNNLSNK